MATQPKTNLLGRFAQHRVAANLLMFMMISAGIWALLRINTQFFPTFNLDLVNVRVVWNGASAEDIESAITNPLEQELKNVDRIHKMVSTASEGIGVITLEFEAGTDMGLALDQTKEKVDLVRNLPSTAEKPEVSQIVWYEPIARLLVSGPSDSQELRPLVQRFKNELLDRGIGKITTMGLADEEIAIEIPSERLRELGLSLEEIGNRLSASSQDLPVGLAGREDTARQLRFLDQRRRELAFENLPISVSQEGQRLILADIATISRRARSSQVAVSFRGRPAVELLLQRAENSDSLESAQIFESWLQETQAQLPLGIELHVYDQQWQLIDQRINLLLKNGLGGLFLVVAILFLFLNGRVAFWVTIGIPVSFLATLAIVYLIGGSINMISLFALIMTLGIIVDDAIVVGEDSLTRYQSGESALSAAEGGARRMFAPVMSSSLTTIAAFLPLMLIGGIIGNMLVVIPIVVICVIIASLVESFLILPGHLHHSFSRAGPYQPKPRRKRLDDRFDHFRNRFFRPLITWAIDRRWTTVAAGFSIFFVTIGLLIGGRIAFIFFPTPDGSTLFANLSFVSGTPVSVVEDYLSHMESALADTEQELGSNLIIAAVVRQGTTIGIGHEQPGQKGDQFASILVELTQPDDRSVKNNQFIRSWRSKLKERTGIDSLTITERRGGPPGRDVQIRLTGNDSSSLKTAATELIQFLSSVPGVSALKDDLPYGREQLVFELAPAGHVLGLTVDQVGRQLRSSYDGFLVQIYTEGEDELEVRVALPNEERNRLASLEYINVVLPGGDTVPLSTVVNVTSRRGFELLKHAEGKLSVTVLGDVDTSLNNSNQIRTQLEATILPDLAEKYGLNYFFEGREEEQTDTLSDMLVGLLYALLLIYLVLAWVFGSYGLPFVVMSIIPFGLIGGVWGHYLLGYDLTILSLFGFFGVSGIVVNDSIVLLVFYQHLRKQGMDVREAIIEAGCQRLRAVILTSLTTIAGLTPLLFETSLQAQFLIPMAISIAFGLGFATLLVLLLVPSLLFIYERLIEYFSSNRLTKSNDPIGQSIDRLSTR